MAENQQQSSTPAKPATESDVINGGIADGLEKAGAGEVADSMRGPPKKVGAISGREVGGRILGGLRTLGRKAKDAVDGDDKPADAAAAPGATADPRRTQAEQLAEAIIHNEQGQRKAGNGAVTDGQGIVPLPEFGSVIVGDAWKLTRDGPNGPPNGAGEASVQFNGIVRNKQDEQAILQSAQVYLGQLTEMRDRFSQELDAGRDPNAIKGAVVDHYLSETAKAPVQPVEVRAVKHDEGRRPIKDLRPGH